MSSEPSGLQNQDPSTGWGLRILFAVGVVGIFLVYWIDPSKRNFFPTCPFHLVTGFYCPGCGATRAVHQLLHGQFLAAMHFNALVVIALPILAVGVGSRLLDRNRPPVIEKKNLRSYWIWLIFGVIMVFWILRNLPGFPFNCLSPPPSTRASVSTASGFRKS